MANEIISFGEIEWFDFSASLTHQIRDHIGSQQKDYILKVDENEYKMYLTSEFELEELEIILDTEEIIPTVTHEEKYNERTRRRFKRDVYVFEIRYSFKGSPILFRVRPSNFSMTANKIYVDDKKFKVSYFLRLIKRDKSEFEDEKKNGYNHSFMNIGNINSEVSKWNAQLPQLVSTTFDQIKSKYQSEMDFFKEINAKINPDTSSIFTVPTIKKRIIPKPEVSSKDKYHNFPTMSMEMYIDVLKVIYDAGKALERKPSLYKDKDEEGLRDYFLYLLETRYEGTTATGETFNRKGKTDILLKYSKDGTNLFVAECKFWHGKEEFFNAIDQLFENYLTWRDSKTALIIFVQNKDFTRVLKLIQEEISSHNLFVKSNGSNGETSLSFIFRLPQDQDKEIYFEVMLFHFDN